MKTTAVLVPVTLAAAIIAVIVERPTCLVCIKAKGGMTTLDAVRGIERIGQNIVLAIERGADCRVCGSSLGPVYSLA